MHRSETARSGFFTAPDGVRLHYLVWGDSAHPPIACFHGGAHTAHVWNDLAPRLADRYWVVALDQRGHGDSDWQPDGHYSRAGYAADIQAFFDQLGIAQAAIVGHSLGGNNALRFAAQCPARVSRLVLVDVGPSVNPRSGAAAEQILRPAIKDSPDAFIEEALARNPRRSRAFFEWTIRPNLKQLPDGRWTWKHDPRFRMVSAWQRTPEGQAATWPLLPQIRCPVLLVRAERSLVEDDAIARMAAALADFRVVTIPGTGHNVHFDDPDAFAAAVIPFLEAGR